MIAVRWCHPELVEGLQRWLLKDDYVADCIATIKLRLPRSVHRSVILWSNAWQFTLNLFQSRNLVRLEIVLNRVTCKS
jgi:hypothetical protein